MFKLLNFLCYGGILVWLSRSISHIILNSYADGAITPQDQLFTLWSSKIPKIFKRKKKLMEINWETFPDLLKSHIFKIYIFWDYRKYTSSFVNLMDLVFIRQIMIVLKILTFIVWEKPVLPLLLPNISMAGILYKIWISIVGNRDKQSTDCFSTLQCGDSLKICVNPWV